MDTQKPFVYTCQWLQGVVVLLHRWMWMPSTECSVLVKNVNIQCSLKCCRIMEQPTNKPLGGLLLFIFLNHKVKRDNSWKISVLQHHFSETKLGMMPAIQTQKLHKNMAQEPWLWLYKLIISLACAIVLRLHASEKPWTDPISIFCFLLVSWSTGKVGCCFKL